MLEICCSFFFCFKQKTAYEMRISDWSSDVCSSDLVLCDLRRLVIADLGRERGDEHQRAVHQFVDAGKIGLDPDDAMFGEARHADAQQLDRAQYVRPDQRLEDIEFEMALQAAHRDRKSTRLNSSH